MAHRKEIIRICQAYSRETEERAHELSSQITVACRDGAGFAIPQAGRTSVAAISVFLASKQLKNGEVKERDACTASCLQPKTFKQALEIVKSALDFLYENQAKEERGHFYANMLKEHRVAQIVALQGLMERTEAELLLHGRLSSRYTKPYDNAEDVVRATVFVWACDRCGPALHRKKRGITIPSIAERYGHDSREMAAIYSKLDNVCYPIGEEIEQEVRRIQSQGSRNGVPSAQSSPTKSQKPTFPSLPSVFTPARSNASDLTPSNSRPVSPIKSAMRRKSPVKSAMKTPTRSNKRPFANEDLDTETDDTPSKPRKKLKFADDEADAVAAFHAVLATPRPLATPTKPKTRQTRSAASSSKVMLDATVNSANDEDSPFLSQEIGDVDDAGHQSDGDGSHSDMEVEAYIDTTVLVKGGEEEEDDDTAEPSAPGPEQPEAPAVETPRRANRIAQLALTPTSIQRAPMTPTRKRGRPPKQTPTTPKSGRKVQLPESDEEAEEETEAPPRRRYRPILLSHKQWLARDPRTGEQARRAETWKAKMVERYGYPPALDKLRSLVIQED